MEEVRLSPGPIRYREVGSGQPLVFAHGLLVNGRLWEPLVERLQADFRCIVPDLPLGSHAVPMSTEADLSVAGVAALVSEMIEALELEGVTLVGNDSGGAISQLVATRYPRRIGRMVLTNCDLYENFPPKLFSYLKLAARIPGALQLTVQSLRFRPLRRTPLAYGALTKKRLDSELLDDWLRPGLRDAAILRDARKFIRGMDPQETIRAARELEGFTAPTLFAWAEEDRWFRIDDAERLAAAMPDARLERIADAKTFVSLDQPDRLAELIGAFAREAQASTA